MTNLNCKNIGGTYFKSILISFLLLFFCIYSSGQGKYAGYMKKMISISYTDSRNIPGLEGWEFRQGSMVTPIDNPEMIIADVFHRGNTWICLFSIKEDTASEIQTIMDVVEVKNVLKGWQLYTTSCRQNKVENVEIVALVKWSPSQEFLKPAKQAWRFNRDKRRFEIASVKGVDCINEGLD